MNNPILRNAPLFWGWSLKCRSVVLLALLAIVSVGIIAGSHSGPSHGESFERLRGLAGGWSVQVTTEIQQASFPALISFTSDGIVLADEPPSPFETTGHGNWVAVGPREAAFTFRVLVGGGPDGQLSLSYKVVGKLIYNPRSDTWSGPFKIQVSDPNGNEVFADRGTFEGTRIPVEVLD